MSSESEEDRSCSESEGAVRPRKQLTYENCKSCRKYRTKSGKRKVKRKGGVSPIANMDELVNLWHRRLAHTSLTTLRKFFETHGIQLPPKDYVFPICSICSMTKLTTKVYDQKRLPAARPGEITSADIIGPISPLTFPHHYKFLLTVGNRPFYKTCTGFPTEEEIGDNKIFTNLF